MSSVVDEVRQSIVERNLLLPKQSILMAVSGGVDSMVLLQVLHELSAEFGWRLAVGHLDHQLRGKASSADARLVQRTARSLGMEVVTEKADVRGYSRARKLSVEMAARELRHRFLANTASAFGIGTIALAHHLDDQMELFLLRLLRGSGGQGLAGMEWRDSSPVAPHLELVRPLLGLTKSAIQQFASDQAVVFREDASNQSLDIPRNRIRKELVPWLKEYQPALEVVIPRVMEILSAESEFVGEVANRWVSSLQGQGKPQDTTVLKPYLATPFAHLPLAVQRRCVQIQLMGLGLKPEFDLIEKLRRCPETAVEVGIPAGETSGRRVQRDVSGLVQWVSEMSSVTSFSPACLVVDLSAGAGEVVFDGVEVTWRISLTKSGRPPKKKLGEEFFDADQLGNAITLRHWQRGDRFMPIGMRNALKLQDFFVNQRVPRPRRHELALATAAAGEVFWVEGMRIAEGFKVTAATNRRLHWIWRRR